MAQANFAYASAANDAAGLPLALSVFADRAHLRELMREDAEAAGFRLALAGDRVPALEMRGGRTHQREPAVVVEAITTTERIVV